MSVGNLLQLVTLQLPIQRINSINTSVTLFDQSVKNWDKSNNNTRKSCGFLEVLLVRTPVLYFC